MDFLLKAIARIAQPHMSKFFFNKPMKVDWRTDVNARPTCRVFDDLISTPYKRPKSPVFASSTVNETLQVPRKKDFKTNRDFSIHPYKILCLDGT